MNNKHPSVKKKNYVLNCVFSLHATPVNTHVRVYVHTHLRKDPQEPVSIPYFIFPSEDNSLRLA